MRIFLLFLVVMTVSESYAQYDANSNGTADIALTRVEGDQLRWFLQDFITN